ncbi:GlsB/YeaQ/YmgE family stress response membrane protein [bacterium]|nr:GlsB/YeaQ/YmgE family stress response membrane protein [bacterium]
MEFVLLLVVGAAAGFLATRMMNLQTDIPTTIAIGVGGAIIGGLVIRTLVELTGWMAGFVGAVLGALVLIWVWRTYLRRR